MKKVLLIILSSLFVVPLFAQTIGWEKFDPDDPEYPTLYIENEYTYERKTRTKDLEGNEWKILNYQLCRIKNGDTTKFNDFPPLNNAEFIRFATTNNPGNHVQIGLGNKVAFAMEARPDWWSMTSTKNYLGVFDGERFEYFDITSKVDYLFHSIFIIGDKVYLVHGDQSLKLLCFDMTSKVFTDITDGNISHFIYTDDSTFLLNLSKDSIIYTITDMDPKLRKLSEGKVKFLNADSDNNIIYTTADSPGKLFRYNHTGLKEFIISYTLELGHVNHIASRKKNGSYVYHENGVVFYSNDNIKENLFTNESIRPRVNIGWFAQQDNGVLQMILNWGNGSFLSHFDGKINSEFVSEFDDVMINAFYKEVNGDNFFYAVLNTKDSLAKKNVIIIKNNTDTSAISFPDYVYKVNGLKVSGKYLWAVVTTHSWEIKYIRLDRTRSLISGKIFYDKNQNGIYDSGEYGVGNYPVIVKPSGLKLLPSESGEFSFSGDRDSLYTLELPDADLFNYSSVQLPYQVNNGGENLIGITLKNPVAVIKPEFVVPRSRCSVKSVSILPVVNSGFADAEKVKITIKGNDHGKLSADENSQMAEGNQLHFEISDLKVNAAENLTYYIQWAPGEFTGQFAQFNLQVELYKENSVIAVIHDTISSEIRCSWDPNDKAVTPAGVEEQHYTRMNSTLSYLIRFENTGNDTAYTVAVYDTLNANLDYNSLKVLGSSHPVQTEINKDKVVFRFENILLPDAKTDKEKAQGFVRFSVKPKADLPEYTVIKNRAGIVFDMNTPVITNEVFNTMGDSPVTLAVPSEQTDNGLSVYPNPANDVISVKGIEKTEVEILDIYGMVRLQTNETDVNISSLEPGVYFVKTIGLEGQKTGQMRFVKVD